jgi:hypothetical protein
MKRVQILIVEKNKKETWEENVNEANTIETLNSFTKIDNGEKPPPPKEWKCKTVSSTKQKYAKYHLIESKKLITFYQE